jgi:archaellum component FlaC
MQRKIEYSKSFTKTSDYPSVPEFQKKHRDRHERELADLEKSYKSQVAQFDKSSAEYAACLVQALPLDIEALVQRRVQELLPKRIGELKLADDLEKKLSDQFQDKITAQQKTIDELLETSQRLTGHITSLQNEKTSATAATVDTDAGQLEQRVARLETQQTTDREAQQDHFTSIHKDVAKLRLEKARFQEDINSLRDTVARQDDVATVREDCSDIKANNARLSALVDETRTDNRKLGTRLEEYAGLTRAHDVKVTRLGAACQEHQDTISRLDVTSSQHHDAISRLDGMTKEHQRDLSRLDLSMLEQMAEGWQIEWPGVLSSVKALQGVKGRLDRLEKVVQDEDYTGRLTPVGSTGNRDRVSRQGSTASQTVKEDLLIQDLKARVSIAEDKVQKVNTFATNAMLGISRTVDSLANRMQTIETRLPSSVVDGLTNTPTQFEAMNLRVDFLASQATQLETRLEEVSRQATPAQSLLQSDPEVTKFKTKVERFEGDFEKLTTEVKGVAENYEMLNFQVTNLDNQYNNITTKSLAEHIIAQMERVYPNNREILANMQELQRRMSKVEQDLKRLNLAVGQHGAPGQPAQKKRKLAAGEANEGKS